MSENDGDDLIVWGVRVTTMTHREIWLADACQKPIWSFNYAELEHWAHDRDSCDVRPLPDAIIATIPEAAAGLANYLNIKRLRLAVRNEQQAAQGSCRCTP
jgi:hypothetical protein